MNYTPPYPMPPVQPKKRQFPPVLLGIGYMVLHIVLLYAVQITALIIFVIQAVYQLGNDASRTEIVELSEKLLYGSSEIISIITQFLTVAVVILIFFIIRRVKKEDKPSFTVHFSLRKTKPSVVFMSALLAFGAYFTVISIISLISLVFPEFVENYNESMESVSGSTNYILQFITLVIGAPLCEELIYRNMAITNLNKRIAPMISVLITAAVFGMAHGLPLQVLYAGALGFVFGILFIRTDSIYPSLVAHTIFNFLGFIFSVIEEFIAPESVAEAVLNIVIVVLIVLGHLGTPFVFWWIIKHTNTPKRIPKRKQPIEDPMAQPVYPQNTQNYGYVPYTPYSPQYGRGQYTPNTPHTEYAPYYPYQTDGQLRPQYPPQGYYPPQNPQPYPGWVFDQRYGWIFVGSMPNSANTTTVPPHSDSAHPTETAPTEETTPSDTTTDETTPTDQI